MIQSNRRATRQRAAGRPGLKPGPSGKRNTGKTRANAPPINPKGKQANSKKPPKKGTKTTPNKKKQKTASTVVVRGAFKHLLKPITRAILNN